MKIREPFNKSLMNQGHKQTQIDKAWKRATVISRVEGFSECQGAIESVTQDILEGILMGESKDLFVVNNINVLALRGLQISFEHSPDSKEMKIYFSGIKNETLTLDAITELQSIFDIPDSEIYLDPEMGAEESKIWGYMRISLEDKQ